MKNFKISANLHAQLLAYLTLQNTQNLNFLAEENYEMFAKINEILFQRITHAQQQKEIKALYVAQYGEGAETENYAEDKTLQNRFNPHLYYAHRQNRI